VLCQEKKDYNMLIDKVLPLEWRFIASSVPKQIRDIQDVGELRLHAIWSLERGKPVAFSWKNRL
jgi:hypothetical protein